MSDIILYLSLVVAGYVGGAVLRRSGIRAPWVSPSLSCAVILLVFTMGLRIGANQEVTANLGIIGASALLFTVATLVFSAGGVAIARRFLGIDRRGLVVDDKQSHAPDIPASGEEGSSNKMAIVIACAVIGGLGAGLCATALNLIPFAALDNACAQIIHLGLCLLLALIGIDLGVEGTVLDNLKKAGARVLAIPCVVIVATLAAAALCSLITPVTLKEGLAIGSGFGWYSLAPGIIMDQGYLMAGAISFLHNVLRELFSLISIPFVARYAGYLECCGLPGAAAMDTCLPVIGRSTNGITMVYAFVSGLVLSLLVPVMVPLFL